MNSKLIFACDIQMRWQNQPHAIDEVTDSQGLMIMNIRL